MLKHKVSLLAGTGRIQPIKTCLRVESFACPVLSTFQVWVLSAVTATKVTPEGDVERVHKHP